MDEDIRLELKELSRKMQDVGRFIGSNKRTLEELESMSKVLKMHRQTLDTYIRVQKMRNKDS
jgi:hypothetical protein